MAANERTPLTRPNDPPTYIEYAGLLRTRRTKIRQFQCCVCAFLLAIFIMALVIAVSYSINEVDPLVSDSRNPEEVPPPPSLKSEWTPSTTNTDMYNRMTSTTLTIDEWNEAILAGQKAIASREAADAMATPLPTPSPNSRHQYAVKTSLQAGKLALAGIGELAATRNIEDSRTKIGAPSSVGSYFKNIWAPDGTCKEFAKISCPPSKYRNFDGTCNHPKNYGSALTPFIRKLPPVYADGLEAPRIGKYGRALPSAREISLKVHPPSPSSNPSFTVMLAVFGQFLDHDITATALSQGTNGSSLTCCPIDTHKHPECFPVEVATGDPVYDLAGRDCMEFVRSAPAPQCKIGPRQQLNQVTSFIDGSVIYGPDIATAQTLREGQGGLLRMFKTPDNRTLLPQSTDPNDGCNRDAESARGRYCFASGDGRANENLHLTTMHLLWARQHNRIATNLHDVNPSWSDETIYQETRRIIGAQLQHITYNEFVPTVIGEKEINQRGMKPLTSGFRMRNNPADVNPAIANNFAAAAFRFAHTLLPGLMKVTDMEKSTSSYVELHRMLFNPYSLYSKGGMESSLTAATSNSIQRTTTHVTSQLTKHLFEDPLANKTIPCGLDLVSLNIQRGRDHGLPGYTAWRQYCGLGKVNSFDELRGYLDGEALERLSELYADVDDVDLYTGALAEIDKADGLVGPTFRCLIGDQFGRIQQGDRFWYEVPGEEQSFTEGQLKEIRKTTLAKIICDCSDGINEIQPWVMRSVNPENPMTSCEDIPEFDFKAWQDASTPVLKATPTEIPETWTNFKEEINKTVNGIVDFFGKPPPAAGSPDWTIFKDWINKSFADIKNEISELHPKPMETLSDELPSAKTKKNKSKQFPATEFEKTPEGVVKPAGKFNWMQFVMDKSLIDLNQYTETAAIQSTTYDDWISFKNDVNNFLNDALVNLTGMPTPQQREELKKQIAAEINDLKSEIASMKSAKLSAIRETAIRETAIDDDATADWLTFKSDVVKAVTDAVGRIQTNAPPPGDPAWSSFGYEIKSQFAEIKNHIPVLPPKKLMAKDPSAAAYWDNFRDSLNKSINNAVADIDNKMPAPGDPAWTEFEARIKNDFAALTIKPKLLAKDPSVKDSKIKDPAFATYWDNFKDSLNKSISNAVADIAAKSPPPGDPAWAAFGAKIMTDFSALKDKFTATKNNPILQAKETIKDPAIDAYWNDFRTSLNASINNAVAEIAAKNLPPGDPAWATFGTKIMNDFAGFKIQPKLLAKDPSVKDSKIKDPAFATYWDNFKDSLNKSISNAVADIAAKSPPPGDPAWAAFGAKIMIDFSALKDKFTATKNNPILQAKETIKDPAIDAYWNDFRTSLNASINNAVAGIAAKNLPPGDPAWATFGAKIMNDFAGFKIQPKLLAKDPSVKDSKIKDPAFATYWDSFKDSLNKSISNAVADIAAKSPPPGDPAWAAFGAKIMTDFSALKDKFTATKNNPILQAKETIKDPVIDAYWNDFRTSLNASINNAVAEIAAKNLPPGDPAWATFGAKIMNDFAGFKIQPKLLAKDLSVKESKIKDPAFATYWDNFKDSLNKSISNAVADIAAKSPPPGDPAWAAFGAKIMTDFSALKDKFTATKNNPILQAKETIKDPAIDAYWNDFRTSLNASINNAVAEIAAKNFPPGDPAWATFGAKIMNDFAVLKDKFAAMHEIKEKASPMEKVVTFDWLTFKTDIINSVADTVNTIKKNMPPPGSPAWAAFKGQVMNGFAKIPSELSPSLKASAIVTPENNLQPAKKTFDWMAFKNEITKSVTDIINDKEIPADLPPGDPKWADFAAKFKKFNTTFDTIKSEIDELRPKPEESQFAILTNDWMDFKEKINKSLTETIELIKSKAPPSYDPGWIAFKDSIKDEFAALKNEINFVKSEASLKSPGTAAKTIESSPNAMKTSQNIEEKQTIPDFTSDLFSLQKGTNGSFAKLKNRIATMKLGATAAVISAADWISFKQQINEAVTNFVDAFNGTQTEEWKNMKDFAKKSFAELRNEIISLRDKTAGLQEKSATSDSKLRLQAKKPKDFTKNGKNSVDEQTLFDWETLKSDVSATVQNLLGDIKNMAPNGKPSTVLKDSLTKAQDKFANLKLSPWLSIADELPTDWAVFVNGVNKTLNSVIKKINALKPIDIEDSMAMKVYEKEVDDFFESVKGVVDKKKMEFEAATSMGSSISSFFGTITTIVQLWIVFMIL